MKLSFIDVLNDSLSELLHNRNRISSSDEDAISKLIKIFNKEKSMRLFNFWKTYYSKDNHIKKLLKKNNSSKTFLRNFKDLNEAGVGVPTGDSEIPFDFSIPNINVVNTDISFPVALATEKE